MNLQRTGKMDFEEMRQSLLDHFGPLSEDDAISDKMSKVFRSTDSCYLTDLSFIMSNGLMGPGREIRVIAHMVDNKETWSEQVETIEVSPVVEDSVVAGEMTLEEWKDRDVEWIGVYLQLKGSIEEAI